ncbi:MAG TPA: alpha/beta hydrolase [Sneathiellales bacterium]|nr:alpha/beta hydrolase [Sneathiellales bacterium]
MALDLFRYQAKGVCGLIGHDNTPPGTLEELVNLKAEDGGESRGVLYTQGGEKTAVIIMHPRVEMTRHYLIPALINAGYAVFGQESRWNNNDAATIHEMLMADVAAGMVFLKETRNFQQVACVGNSGGGSLFTFYQAQAATQPPGRLTDTAAGDPYDLNKITMPQLDGAIILAAHGGQGQYLMGSIDPSVTDEVDPLSRDSALDMYNIDNGFQEPPMPTRYEAAFVDAYRQGQRARIARIDAIAKRHIAEQRLYQGLMLADGFAEQPFDAREEISQRAVTGRYMTINRTEANLAFCDPSIDPSTRDYGSLWSRRPDLFNYTEAGFCKVMTPRGWLSTWSGLSSRAVTEENIVLVTIPTLLLYFAGDNCIFPSLAHDLLAACGASDKELIFMEGDHFGYPNPDRPKEGGRAQAGAAVIDWLKPRFPPK